MVVVSSQCINADYVSMEQTFRNVSNLPSFFYSNCSVCLWSPTIITCVNGTVYSVELPFYQLSGMCVCVCCVDVCNYEVSTAVYVSQGNIDLTQLPSSLWSLILDNNQLSGVCVYVDVDMYMLDEQSGNTVYFDRNYWSDSTSINFGSHTVIRQPTDWCVCVLFWCVDFTITKCAYCLYASCKELLIWHNFHHPCGGCAYTTINWVVCVCMWTCRFCLCKMEILCF